jgi:exopolyphosphatase/guanosine-5'-triphosphate,3'-diphosphate pyrophosphatase
MSRTMIGAIDAGSNAIRYVIAEMTPTEVIRVEADRMPVRLGGAAFTRGELEEATIDAAVAAFSHFRERFNHHGVSMYRAIGTSAMRDSHNRDVLLHRLYHEAGIEVEVIEGEEEARLVRKAVLHALGASAPKCILDLGGGSLEINVRSGSAWRGHSLPVGTVRLLETFGLNHALSDAEAGMVRRYTATLTQGIFGASGIAPSADLATAAVTGGNAEALAALLTDGSSPPGFELGALEKALPDIVGASVEERMHKLGIRRDRAEVISVAALVFATVGRQLGISRFVAPGVGIREALLLELAESARNAQLRSEGAHDKALLTAARTFAHRAHHDTSHGEQVRKLAASLFRQLRDVHQLGDRHGVLLEVAALLHDIGEVVNTRGHHKHSEYMIRWGRLPGLLDDEREMVALAARCHRKPVSDVKKIVSEAPLSKEQRGQLRKIAAILRLADGLDTEHRQRISQLVCTRMGDAIVLDLTVRDGPSRDDAQLLRKADLFREELGLDVRMTIAKDDVVAAAASGSLAAARMSRQANR